MSWALDRQLDISLLNAEVFTLPKSGKGRLTRQDLISFNWPHTLNPAIYMVALEALDTAGAPHRTIGSLATTLEIPSVHFGPTALLSVLPNDAGHPAFYGTLVRGASYVIPDTRGQNGKFHLTQHGKTGLS